MKTLVVRSRPPTQNNHKGGDCSRPLGTAACWEVHSRDKGQKVVLRDDVPEDSGHVGPVVLNSLCYFVETLVLNMMMSLPFQAPSQFFVTSG